MEVSQNSISKRYSCSKCGFETDYIVHLKNHLCSPKKYENGSVTSNNKGNPVQHTWHQNTTTINSSYQRMKKVCKFSCSDCGYSCKSLGLLKLHKNIHYTGLYKCSCCSFITNFENLYRMHQEKHKNIENGSQEVKNKSICSEPDNKTTIDSSNDGVEIKKTSDKIGYECSFCPFTTSKIRTFGKHLNRFHCRELSFHIGNFLGEGYVKPRVRNSLSPEEIASLTTTAMEVSDVIMGKSKNIIEQIDASAAPSVKSAINKIKNYPNCIKAKKLKTWTKEEKIEIYWCDVFSRNAIFPKPDISKRRRKALIERGVLNAEKLKETPDSLFHSIIANIKIGKSSVSKQEALSVVKQVEDYVKSKVNSAHKNMKESDDDLEYLFNFESDSQNKRVIRK